MSRVRSSLGSLQTPRMDVETVKHKGWAEQGILVVAMDDERLDWAQREQVKQLGEYLYGKREPRNGK